MFVRLTGGARGEPQGEEIDRLISSPSAKWVTRVSR